MPKPPNLKAAKECGDCRWFNGKDTCKKYTYPVTDDETCDSWSPANVKESSKRAWASHRRRLERNP